jgi:hypothetical protein
VNGVLAALKFFAQMLYVKDDVATHSYLNVEKSITWVSLPYIRRILIEVV